MALQYDKIVLFGDSITERTYDQATGFGFGPALQNLYTRKLDVIQRGYGGYNSDHAALLIDSLIEQETTDASKIRLLIVFFGTNDSSTAARWQQHVPIDRYKSNLRNIASAATAADIKLLLIGPGPFNAHQWLVDKQDRRGQRTTLRARDYCDAAVEVAKELGVPVIPLWYAIMEDLGWSEGDPYYGLEEITPDNPLVPYLTDGLHFAAPAYNVEFREVMKAIEQSYPELLPNALPTKLPVLDTFTKTGSREAALNYLRNVVQGH